jgi:putative endopeptidase
MIGIKCKHGMPSWARIAILIVSMGLLPLNGPAADSLLRFSPKNLDQSIDACEDFYQYTCGGWLQANRRPADAAWWGGEDVLEQHNTAVLREILERARKPDPKRSATQRVLGDYYAACMDEDAIEARGLGPINEELSRIARLKNKIEIAAEVARLHRMLFLIVQGGIFPSWVDPGSRETLFGLYPAQDAHDSKRVIVFVDQGGLGMGNRNYYLNDDEATRSTRNSYVSHVQRLLALAAGAPVPRQSAERILEIETMLARSWAENATRINPNNVYHAYSLLEIQGLTPTFAWPRYFSTLGIAPPSHYVVSNPAFLQEVERLLQVISLRDWQLYLRSQLLAAAAPLLNKDFVDEDFDFGGKVMQGIERPSSRSVRCRRAVDRDLPDALGREFVNAAFLPEDRRRVAAIADVLQAAMREDLLTSDWLDGATRGEALAKIKMLRSRIGYPARWHDYSGLKIGRRSWAKNAFAASSDRVNRSLGQIGHPPDLNVWFMTPTTIDAYANPRQLTITVPAAIIGPPNFDPESDDPLNFGGIGATIGHEITHSFDTVGRHYDHNGNLADWWTPKSAEAFAERAQCISKQYSEFVAVDDVKLNGEQTSSENIADAGGLRIALMALRRVLADRQGPDPMIDGFSALQRLFLGYGTSFCTHITPEALRDAVSGDRHSPVKYRVNGVVSNMREFREAFSCKKGQAMVHEPTCRVW